MARGLPSRPAGPGAPRTLSLAESIAVLVMVTFTNYHCGQCHQLAVFLVYYPGSILLLQFYTHVVAEMFLSIEASQRHCGPQCIYIYQNRSCTVDATYRLMLCPLSRAWCTLSATKSECMPISYSTMTYKARLVASFLYPPLPCSALPFPGLPCPALPGPTCFNDFRVFPGTFSRAGSSLCRRDCSMVSRSSSSCE